MEKGNLGASSCGLSGPPNLATHETDELGDKTNIAWNPIYPVGKWSMRRSHRHVHGV